VPTVVELPPPEVTMTFRVALTCDGAGAGVRDRTSEDDEDDLESTSPTLAFKTAQGERHRCA